MKEIMDEKTQKQNPDNNFNMEKFNPELNKEHKLNELSAVTLIEIDNLKLIFRVILNGDALNKRLDAFVKNQYEYEKPNIAGFIKGKMPPMMVMKDYYINRFKRGIYSGSDNLFGYVLVEEIKRAASLIKEEYDINQSLNPEFFKLDSLPEENINTEKASFKFEDYVYHVNIELIPPVSNLDLSTISITVPKVEVTDSDVIKSMEHWAKNNVREEDLETPRVVQNGDIVYVKLSIPGKEETLDHFKMQVGKGTFNPDCEKQLPGKNIGESFSYNFGLPKNFPDASVAGRSYNVQVQIQDIKNAKNYEIDEHMFKAFNCTSLEECKQKFKDMLEDENNRLIEIASKLAIRRNIGNAYDLMIPSGLFNQVMLAKHDQLAKVMNANLHYPLTEQEQQFTNPVLESIFGCDYQQWLAKHEEDAKTELKADLYLGKYAFDNKIQLNAKEINQLIASQADNFENGLKEAVEFYEKDKKAYEKLTTNHQAHLVLLAILDKVNKIEQGMSVEELGEYVARLRNPVPLKRPSIKVENDGSLDKIELKKEETPEESKKKTKEDSKSIEKTSDKKPKKAKNEIDSE